MKFKIVAFMCFVLMSVLQLSTAETWSKPDAKEDLQKIKTILSGRNSVTWVFTVL